MPKLGSVDMKDIPLDVAEMSSADEQETQEKITTPSPQVSEPVPLPSKPKRKMTDKQMEALKRGRAKKLEMNLSSREGKKKVPKSQSSPEEKEREPEDLPQPSTSAPAAEKSLKKTRKTKRQKRSTPPVPPSPSPLDTEESEDDDNEEEEYIRYDETKESDVERTVGKYLKRYMDKSMRREKQQLDRLPSHPPQLTRSTYDDILFV